MFFVTFSYMVMIFNGYFLLYSVFFIFQYILDYTNTLFSPHIQLRQLCLTNQYIIHLLLINTTYNYIKKLLINY